MERSATKGNPSTPTARRISGFTAKFLMVMFLITFVIVAVIGTAATLITLSRLHVGKICIEATGCITGMEGKMNDSHTSTPKTLRDQGIWEG
jgi:hypothetical protein